MPLSAHFLLLQLLNGLSLGALFFMVASGFSLIFGLMRVANLSHGGLYLISGYIGLTVIRATGSFLIGIAAAAGAAIALSLIIKEGFLRFVEGRGLSQVLLTVGLAFVIGDLCLAIWGGVPTLIPIPAFLQGPFDLGIVSYPRYRLFLIGVGALIAFGLWALLERTPWGAVIRAGVDDLEMVSALGINIHRVFRLAFLLAALLVGLAGVLGGALLGLYPGGDSDILLTSLVVVIVGGLGSLEGALLGSLLAGFLEAMGKALLPELAYFILFAPMVLILAFRPYGLLGRR
jgi:branched-chain amino acid transport system permease protein